MKMKFFGLGGLFVLLSAIACNNGSSTSSADSTTTSADSSSSTRVSSTTHTKVHLDPAASYVNLKTGKPVKLRVDTVTNYIVDEVTSQPVLYYINPSTNDTFDQRGRLVSRALIRGSDGDYSVDESRITVSPEDNSSSMSSSTGSSDTASATPEDGTAAATGSSKTKIKDDKFKQKTDTSKIKIKDGKVKIKTKPDND